jgi:signal peptidase I
MRASRFFSRAPLWRVAVAAGLTAIVFGRVLVPIRAQGISMEPTLRADSLHLFNRAAFAWRAPSRGEIVTVRLAGEAFTYIKRIVALPGERLAIRRGVVLIDGRALDEPYVAYRSPWELDERTLGPDEYYVIGDNRAMSIDDHEMGRVGRDRIAAKLVF